MRSIFFLIGCFVLTSPPALAHLNNQPEGHAPIGVMADHTHHSGELMVSLRAMYMQMDGLLSGSNPISSSEVFDSTSFMMAPQKMDMWMYMLGAMYGLSDRWMVMAMLPYISSDMTMDRDMQGDTIDSQATGLGDVSLTALRSFIDSDTTRVLITLGVFVPTGDIDTADNGSRLGYPMQLGAGSYALQPGLVFSYYWSRWSIGTQIQLKDFMGENPEGYQRGTEYFANLWSAYHINPNISSSVRLSHQLQEPIDGSDPELNRMMSPANRADLQHGATTMIHFGLNLLGTAFATGHRLGLEVGLPLQQNLSGPQMRTRAVGTLGWQKLF